MVRVNSSETNPAGGGFLGVGNHHCVIEGVEVREDNKGRTQVVYDLVAMASTDADMVGQRRKEYFYVAGPAAGRLWKFLIATGVKTQADWESAKAGNSDTEIDETMAIGRQCCISVKAEKYTAADGTQKDKTDTGFAFFSPDSPEARNTPKDAALYQLYLDSLAGSQQQQRAAGATQTAPAVTASSKADWSKF